tara:strand:- start:23 stop:286 length:264 start_codon:yes stop_codon:yes gene_type:complete
VVFQSYVHFFCITHLPRISTLETTIQVRKNHDNDDEDDSDSESGSYHSENLLPDLQRDLAMMRKAMARDDDDLSSASSFTDAGSVGF